MPQYMQLRQPAIPPALASVGRSRIKWSLKSGSFGRVLDTGFSCEIPLVFCGCGEICIKPSTRLPLPGNEARLLGERRLSLEMRTDDSGRIVGQSETIQKRGFGSSKGTLGESGVTLQPAGMLSAPMSHLDTGSG